MLVLAQSTVDHGHITYGFTAGSHIPLAHTSLGRMLLAGLTAEEAAGILDRSEIPSHTSQSLTSRKDILARVETARAQGYCVTDSEFEAGITGYAVPVARPGRTPVVVGSSAPRGQQPQADAERLLRGLQLCAAELRQAEAVEHL